MAKPKDLTPKFKKMKPAEQELRRDFVAGEMPFGESIGGLQAYSQVFKRGYGDEVFGSSDDGIWLGAADFEDAPFRVNMQGSGFFKGEVQAGDVTVIDDDGLISLAAFDSDSVTVFGKTTTSGTYIDVPDLTLDVELTRDTKVLVLLNVDIVINNMNDTGTGTGLVIVRAGGSLTDIILGTTTVPMYTENYSDTSSSSFSMGGSDLVTLGSGTQTIKAQFKVLTSLGAGGTPQLQITTATLTYATFGR